MAEPVRSPIESGTGQKPAPWKMASWLVLPTAVLVWRQFWWWAGAGIVAIVLLSLQYALIRINSRPFAKGASTPQKQASIGTVLLLALFVQVPIWLGDIILTWAWNMYARMRHHRGRRLVRGIEAIRHADHIPVLRRDRAAVDDDEPTWPPHDYHDDDDEWYRQGRISMPARSPRVPGVDEDINPVERAVRWVFGR